MSAPALATVGVVQVSEDYVCDHGMPKPWVTCVDCMELPFDEQPQPPREVKPKPAPKAATRKARKAPGSPRPKRPAQPPAGRLPRSMSDPLPDLVGQHDLAYEIPPSDLRYFIGGSEAAWLPVSSLPTDLRAGGYVYLQVDEELVARARVKGIGFRERRWDHAAPEVAGDLGPGATIEVDGWQMVSVDLGPDGAVPVPRFRYVTTTDDGSVRVASAS